MEDDEKQKRKRASRVVKGDWPDDKIRQLISGVELRPELWDVGCRNNKIPKQQLWHEVATELGDSYQWQDCRTKWQNLRVTYKSIIAKLEKDKMIGQHTKVHWRFFEAIRFIDRNESQQSTDSTSNFSVYDCSMPLDINLTETSCSTPTLQERKDFPQSTSSTEKHTKRSSTIGTPTPPPSVVKSSIRDIAAQVLQVMVRSDEHSCFGDYIASELRNLPAEHAFALKRRLNRTLLDYWDEMDAQKQDLPSPTIRKHGLRTRLDRSDPP